MTIWETRWPAGSSPRVRGTHAVDFPRQRLLGIIPACAGNTHVPVQEYVPAAGSSPRVRGTHRRIDRGRGRSGIIPACAGNTKRIRSRSAPIRDHPRVCGEHKCHAPKQVRQPGSSPRVRGTLFDVEVAQMVGGIIPACAGNTRTSQRRTRVLGDHPRVCGEHRLRSNFRAFLSGSSPRVRGTRTLQECH